MCLKCPQKMHVRSRSGPLEYFLNLVLVLYLNALFLLIVQPRLTIPKASGRDKESLQNLKFWNAGHLVPLLFFFFLFFFLSVVLSSFLSSVAFCLCHQLLPFQVLLLFLPPWCSLHHPRALSPLPKHWDCSSAFPNIIRLILTLLIGASLLALLTCFGQSWEEGVRTSDSPETASVMWEQRSGTRSGKWLNNRMSHEMQTTWEVWQPLEPQKVVTSVVASSMHTVSVAFTSIVWIWVWFLTDISDSCLQICSERGKIPLIPTNLFWF